MAHASWNDHRLDTIKQKRAAQHNARIRAEAEPLEAVGPGDFVWLKYGDDKAVDQLRHKGAPWKRKFQVVSIDRQKGLVELDVTDSMISKHQSIRRVVKAAPVFNFDDTLDAPGLCEGPTQVDLDESPLEPFDREYFDGHFPIEDVLAARVHTDPSGVPFWEVKVKWKGYSDETWEPRTHIETQTQGKVRRNLERAVNRVLRPDIMSVQSIPVFSSDQLELFLIDDTMLLC